MTKADAGLWDVSAVIEWMLTDGRAGAPRLNEFVDALCARLSAAGAPLWRVRCGFRTLHPQFVARSVIWLRDLDLAEQTIQHGMENTGDYVNSPAQHLANTGKPFRRNLQRLDDGDHSVLHDLAAQGGTDYFGVPLRFSDGAGGIFMPVTDRAGGFSEHDIKQLTRLVLYLNPVLEAISLRMMARVLLDTYVGPRTGRKILDGAVRRGDSEIIRAALWLSDLRDFTRLSETLGSDDMLAMLNLYFETIGDAVTQRGGEILSFIGDAMLIVFAVHDQRSQAEACQDALEAALSAVSNLNEINQQRQQENHPPIRFGIGLNTGEVTYGNIGTHDRLAYTVMGPAVNLVARLESLTKTTNQTILFSRQFADHLQHEVVSHGMHELKGMAELHEALSLGGGGGGC